MVNTIAPAVLGGATARLQDVKQELDATRRSVSELLPRIIAASEVAREFLQQPVSLRKLWAEQCKLFENTPIPAEEVVKQLAPFLGLVQDWESIALLLQGFFGGSKELGGWPLHTGDVTEEQIDLAAQDLTALRTEIADTLAWLNAPPTPARRRLRTTAEIREARQRSEYVSVDDALARLGEIRTAER